MKKIITLFILGILIQFTSAQTFHVNIDNILNKIPPFGYNMITAEQGFGIIGDDSEYNMGMVNASVDMQLPMGA